MTTDHRLKPAGLALGYNRRGERDGVSWVFHHVMTQGDRDGFDAALVAMDHPLAYEAGTQETRFHAYVHEMAMANLGG